jgi:hypothetical protein
MSSSSGAPGIVAIAIPVPHAKTATGSDAAPGTYPLGSLTSHGPGRARGGDPQARLLRAHARAIS